MKNEKTIGTLEVNDALYKRLVSGDESARDEMIVQNMPLVESRVKSYLSNAPQMRYYRDDMVSAGMIGLINAVDGMQKQGSIENPLPTCCMRVAIDRELVKVTDEANTIVVPNRVQKRARSAGKPMRPPVVTSMNGLSSHETTIPSDEGAVDLQDAIDACCVDDLDRIIIKLRAEKMTDEAIGGVVGLVQQAVTTRKNAIYERLQERLKEYEDD